MQSEVRERAGLTHDGPGEVRFSIPAGLRLRLSTVAPGTAITITYTGRQDGRKVCQVTTRELAEAALTFVVALS